MQRRTFLKQSAFFLAMAPVPLASALAKTSIEPQLMDNHIKDQLIRTRYFDTTHNSDTFIDAAYKPILEQNVKRLKRVQKLVGYGNFCLLNFDDALKIGRSYTRVGAFSKNEIDFMEMVFYTQGKTYGFLGDKPTGKITGKINRKTVKKIPYTGNYLFRGKPFSLYNDIKKQLGPDVILTSGVRSIMKQFLLFFNKTVNSDGNLSMASRSLAPPGYSFHGVGDFDVGKKGYGIHNFTERFTRTTVYKKLSDLGFIKFRYELNNTLGVRFEPWHIEVI